VIVVQVLQLTFQKVEEPSTNEGTAAQRANPQKITGQ